MHDTLLTLEVVQRALSLPDFEPQSAQARMAPRVRGPGQPDQSSAVKLASVLVLLFTGSDGALHFPLIRRNEYPGVHSGQIALPGGRREADETFEQTALRETQEEVGVPPDRVRILGALYSLYVPPSNFEIHPFVGYVPERPIWRPDPYEVAELIETPLAGIIDDRIKGHTTITRGDQSIDIGFYGVGPHQVWGATAAILSELEARLLIALRLVDGSLPFTP
jgi:8-oxo-dGTP pyrophosphatase MutT (NUDIX family)